MRAEDAAIEIAIKNGVKPKLIKKAMFEQSESVKKKPERLFHATPISNFDSIKEKGILPHSFYGQVYLCEDPAQCLRFVKKPSVIFEVDPKQLNIKRLVYSKDHSRAIHNFNVYAYYNRIFPSALKNWSVY